MLSHDLPNPFLEFELDHTLALPPGDVPELYADLDRGHRQAIADARRIGRGVGIITAGDPGSGKSHLIGRLRQAVEADTKAALALLKLRTGSLGHLWRPVRKSLAEELLRPYQTKGGMQNGLARILHNRFPQWAAAQGGCSGILDFLLGRRKNSDLKPHLEAFANEVPIHYDLLKVLPQLSNPDLNLLANQWLLGHQLSEDDLRRLGLPCVLLSDRERETAAEEIVLSLLRLAGDTTTMVLCFDQVEAIQSSNWDKAVLREFAALAVALVTLPGPRVVLSSLRFNIQTALKDAAEPTDLEKMGGKRTQYTKVIDWEQMLRIVNARVDAEPTCRRERQIHPPEKHWPLGRKFLEEFHRTNRRVLTPRFVIQGCRQEFIRLQSGGGPGDDDLNSILRDKWEQGAARFAKRPASIKFDDVFAKALPWLVHLVDSPFTRSDGQHPGIDDVNLVFFSKKKGQKSVGISLCNDPPTTLWRRLDRLKGQWAANRGKTLGSLHLLRYADERTTDTALVRFEALQADGVRVHLIPTQQLVELSAYQTMLAEVNLGDLTLPSGKPVELPEYDDWVREHFPQTQSVKELLIDLFGPLPEPAAKRQMASAGAAHE